MDTQATVEWHTWGQTIEHMDRASFRNFPKGGGKLVIYGGGGGGAKLSLVPSPSLIVHRKAHGALQAGKKKVSTVCAYVHTYIRTVRMLYFMKQ